jgi:hypothetical protein
MASMLTERAREKAETAVYDYGNDRDWAKMRPDEIVDAVLNALDLADITDGVKTFLYLLMRDKVPTGTVKAIINEMDKLRELGLEPEFSSPELERLAARYAHEIQR